MSCISGMNVGGPLTRPNFITLQVHLVALGPEKVSFSWESLAADLMITLWHVPHPKPKGCAKGKEDSQIASGNGVWNDAGNLIQRDRIDAKTPNKVGNVCDAFLVRFWH